MVNNCSGGWPQIALYIMAFSGNVLLKDYPYFAMLGLCRKDEINSELGLIMPIGLINTHVNHPVLEYQEKTL
jgi:hypothetical protein